MANDWYDLSQSLWGNLGENWGRNYQQWSPTTYMQGALDSINNKANTYKQSIGDLKKQLTNIGSLPHQQDIDPGVRAFLAVLLNSSSTDAQIQSAKASLQHLPPNLASQGNLPFGWDTIVNDLHKLHYAQRSAGGGMPASWDTIMSQLRNSNYWFV